MNTPALSRLSVRGSLSSSAYWSPEVGRDLFKVFPKAHLRSSLSDMSESRISCQSELRGPGRDSLQPLAYTFVGAVHSAEAGRSGIRVYRFGP